MFFQRGITAVGAPLRGGAPVGHDTSGGTENLVVSWRNRNLGSARASRAGEGALALANFGADNYPEQT